MFNIFSKKTEAKNDALPKPLADPRTAKDILDEEKVYQEGLVRLLDLISPSAIGINASYLQVGEVFCRTMFVAAFPKVLSIGWVGPLINLDFPMDISFFVHPIETQKILPILRKRVTQMQSQMNIESGKGLTRDPMLEMAYSNIENLRNQLQEGVERFFKTGIYITIFGKSLEDMEKNASALEAILNARSIYIKKAIFRTKEGFTATLPIGIDTLLSGSDLNTSPLSTAFPFISSDVTSNRGILYGINRHNNSLILFDRFSMENANMVIFAKSGAGKSYTVKLEILRSMMMGISAIIIDPEDEYRYLGETVGGSYINISLNSPHHINPFELYAEQDKEMKDILRSAQAELLGLFKLMMGMITPEEDSILERAIKETYAIRDINEQTDPKTLKTMTMPLLSDFYEVLRNMKGADDLALRLEKYTQGIFSGFLNQASNVTLDSQLVIFNIRDLEEELRPIAMYMILNFIWKEVRFNVKKRLIVIDEAWVMMQYEEAARFVFSVAKRIRKYYGGLTTITQDISDFMTSKYGKAIVSNSSLQILLKQSQSSIDLVADTFYLTEREKYLLLESGVGEGIFFAGLKRAAIQVVASFGEDKIVTSNPAERLQIEKDRKEEELE